MSEPLLTIVSPVYGAGPIVPHLVEQIVAAATRVTADFEIILVEDASPDDAWPRIVAVAAANPRVRGIRLSRNFGQHAAITAGLEHARGEFVVVLDCDLQDDPVYIPDLVAKAREGFDVILTRKDVRRHSPHRNWGASLFSRSFNLLADNRSADPDIGGYSLITRKVVDAFLKIRDAERHYLLLIGWMGFRKAVVPVDHRPRHSGKSSYTVRRLVRHAAAGITSQSTRLLKVAIGLGFLYCGAAFITAGYLAVTYFIHRYLPGWASTIVLLLASTGLILLAIGILGIYLGQIFDQVRQRPLYLVQEEVNAPCPR